MDDDEWTTEEMIQLELHAVETLTKNESCSPIFFQLRDRLTSLLDQLQRGEILAEYAELQLEQIQDIRAQWLNDNQIQPD
jgi:hypothetical protein